MKHFFLFLHDYFTFFFEYFNGVTDLNVKRAISNEDIISKISFRRL